MPKVFNFKTELWVYTGKAAWYFVTLPKQIAHEIKFYYSDNFRGWGSLPVSVTIGKTNWETSIFRDKKSESFMLPIKKQVRELEHLELNDMIVITLEILTYK